MQTYILQKTTNVLVIKDIINKTEFFHSIKLDPDRGVDITLLCNASIRTRVVPSALFTKYLSH